MTNFGRDTSCTTSIRTGRFVSGAMLVGEALFRRLNTPRGVLRGGEEEENYGTDLSAYVGSATTKNTAASLGGIIELEAKKDERILTIDVRVTSTVQGPATKFRVEIRAGTADGPFTLQLSVSSVTTELLGLTAES